jgi:hypothetical protein
MSWLFNGWLQENWPTAFELPELWPRLYDYPEPPEPGRTIIVPAPKDFHHINSEWTLAHLLAQLDLYMKLARTSSTGLYGHAQFLTHVDWGGFKRMTVHCSHEDDNALGASYEFHDRIGWPSHGAVMMIKAGKIGPREKQDELNWIPCHSMYFVRHKKLPWHCRGSAGVPYEFVIVWGVRDGSEPRMPCRFFVTFSPKTFKPSPTAILEHRRQWVDLPRPKHNGDRRPLGYRTLHTVWSNFEDLLDDPRNPDRGPLYMITGWILNMHAQRGFSPLIAISDRTMRISFSVPLEQCPYFFKDRGLTIVTKKGRRAPIMHWVKAHEKHRLIKGEERTIATRMHIRGERQFNWHGYQVSILIPGLHSNLVVPDELAVIQMDKDDPEAKDMWSLSKGVERLRTADHGLIPVKLAIARASVALPVSATSGK